MRLIVTVAAIGLLAACKAQAPADNGAQPVNTTAAAAVTTKLTPIDASAPLGTPVTGDEAKAVMHARHEGMEQLGKATKTIGRELKADAPDLKAIQSAAASLADLSAKSSGWFRPGTGPDVGKTGAKPEIWQSPKDVADKDRAFQEAAQAFNAAAASGDLTRIKASFVDLGKSCKACHDKYRAEMKH